MSDEPAPPRRNDPAVRGAISRQVGALLGCVAGCVAALIAVGVATLLLMCVLDSLGWVVPLRHLVTAGAVLCGVGLPVAMHRWAPRDVDAAARAGVVTGSIALAAAALLAVGVE